MDRVSEFVTLLFGVPFCRGTLIPATIRATSCRITLLVDILIYYLLFSQIPLGLLPIARLHELPLQLLLRQVEIDAYFAIEESRLIHRINIAMIAMTRNSHYFLRDCNNNYLIFP